jgi:hypothetical protein
MYHQLPATMAASLTTLSSLTIQVKQSEWRILNWRKRIFRASQSKSNKVNDKY